MNYRRTAATAMLMACTLALAAQTQKGKASYYSKRSTGARTASGERLHHDSLTCAHRFYPFGTRLRVTNLDNDRSVVVRVTDRGPFGRGRIIDLSYAAAKAIGMLAAGVGRVKVEVVGNAGVPFRNSDEMNLPRVDFEVAEVGYSFIDSWKERGTATETQDRKKEDASPKAGEAKPAAPRTEKWREPAAHTSQRTGTTTQRTGTTTQRTGTANRGAEQKAAPKSSKGANRWSNVFEKIKHWGEDLF